MEKQMKELQQLKGIGPILSQRLVESSYDTIAKVAGAQDKGLERIVGITPHKARAIATQARAMTGKVEKSWHSWADKENQGHG